MSMHIAQAILHISATLFRSLVEPASYHPKHLSHPCSHPSCFLCFLDAHRSTAEAALLDQGVRLFSSIHALAFLAARWMLVNRFP